MRQSGSLGATNRRKFVRATRSSFTKEVSTVPRALSIGNDRGGCYDTARDSRKQLSQGYATRIRLHRWDWLSTPKWRSWRWKFSVSVIKMLGSAKEESRCRASTLDFVLEITLLIPGRPSRTSRRDSWCKATTDEWRAWRTNSCTRSRWPWWPPWRALHPRATTAIAPS